MIKYIFPIAIVLTLLFSANSVLAQEEATDSSSAIREKVQEKVNQVLNSPKAFIGTVTDIAESTIQIGKYVLIQDADDSAEIQQIATGSDTKYVNVAKTSKSIEFSDIAIGDFTIAMGFTNGNGVLDAKRILVIGALQPTQREAYLVKVTKASKSEVVAETHDGKEVTFEPVKSVTVYTLVDDEESEMSFSNIEEGDEIIAIGIPREDVIEVRTIRVISSTEPSPTPEIEE